MAGVAGYSSGCRQLVVLLDQRAAVLALVYAAQRRVAAGAWLLYVGVVALGYAVLPVRRQRTTIITGGGTMVLALVLRTTVNLPLAVMVSVAVGLLGRRIHDSLFRRLPGSDGWLFQ